ncbi:hypothetical protein [Heterosigma akashiwo virus 01]|jgi:predicted GIY-YIG superfamily endonuclease|uniref:Uncharacterized protein n=1 Tax=Heterosigma akashiwo virus 01 TaxID=97195 RepID=A0A1C9C542_HAV01|nr:hypothetical protein D1R72_gp078 [Heterosigma akashiwo virus 01]AOM63409.1 hypothetical protein [Heterosigma akashiwo virus 01]
MLCDLYILTLENNKFYIGRSTNVYKRINDHFNNDGTLWTRLYHPKGFKIVEDCKSYDEFEYTIEYMKKYGINSVRGSIFCNIDLEPEDVAFIEKLINCTENRCYKCKNTGHFASECLSFNSRCFHCNKLGHIKKNCPDVKCYRCGVHGHYSSFCPTSFCYTCKKYGHYSSKCDLKIN